MIVLFAWLILAFGVLVSIAAILQLEDRIKSLERRVEELTP